ncbi:MAG: transcriptional repressor [Sphingomonas adhaesiva]|uniref:Fur family transcriptional regulator n=1 Tax=Sphingomonas adhaesiva TaxID=28212 RepID=UPI002FFB10F4
MGNHGHHEPEGEALLTAAQAALERSGEQWTAMRGNVFAALTAFDKPASAYDIAEAMSATQGRRIAANSIYRILDLFVTANLAQRVESANAYVVNAHPGCRHDCIFLICDGCGRTTHLDDDRLTAALRETAGTAGFAPERPVIEVRGRCAECRDAAAA